MEMRSRSRGARVASIVVTSGLCAAMVLALTATVPAADDVMALKCGEVSAVGEDASRQAAMTFLKGFIMGANAAAPQLTDADAWQHFAGALFRRCAEDDEMRFVDALHEVFFAAFDN